MLHLEITLPAIIGLAVGILTMYVLPQSETIDFLHVLGWFIVAIAPGITSMFAVRAGILWFLKKIRVSEYI